MDSMNVSTVIPTYNRGRFIGRAVKSALAASRPGDEVIVVDDGSTDETMISLAPFMGQIQYLNVPHCGAGAARNKGIMLSKNSLVAFLDSDDEWFPDMLSLHRQVMQKFSNIVFSFSDFRVIDENENVFNKHLINWHNDRRSWGQILGPPRLFSSIGNLSKGRDDFHVYVGDLYFLEMGNNYVSTITMVVRRDQAADALRFPEDLPLYEDWECIGRLAKAGKAAFLDTELAINHGHRDARLTDAGHLIRSTTRIKILERVWGDDAEFLMHHEESFRRLLYEQRLLRIKELLRNGNMKEARTELVRISQSPILYKMLSFVPGSIARELFKTYSYMRKFV